MTTAEAVKIAADRGAYDGEDERDRCIRLGEYDPDYPPDPFPGPGRYTDIHVNLGDLLECCIWAPEENAAGFEEIVNSYGQAYRTAYSNSTGDN